MKTLNALSAIEQALEWTDSIRADIYPVLEWCEDKQARQHAHQALYAIADVRTNLRLLRVCLNPKDKGSQNNV